MDQVNISHNGDNHAFKITVGTTTAGDIKTNRGLQNALAIGTNIDAVVNGSVVDDSYKLVDGQEVSFRTRASSKA